jgi:cytochrome c-type biogenesis protein CcmH
MAVTHAMGQSPGMKVALPSILLVLALGLSSVAPFMARADPSHDGPAELDASRAAPGERELLARLVAPCCWNQTLDIHGGTTPDQLRAEIRERLHRGEAPATIEADFVRRYGARVQAHSSSLSLGSASLLVIAVGLVAATGLALVVRRWRRASDTAGAAGAVRTTPAGPDAWDDRVDAELRALD